MVLVCAIAQCHTPKTMISVVVFFVESFCYGCVDIPGHNPCTGVAAYIVIILSKHGILLCVES